jgi:hypothetical protein
MVGIYSLKEKRYVPFAEGSWRQEAEKALGPLPDSYLSWKILHKDPHPEQAIARYFEELFHKKNLGAALAKAFIYRDGEIARSLVEDNIAYHADDVKLVLQNGFYHLYGPQDVLSKEENLCVP